MKTLAILSRKGGSGKSTFAVHLAVAAEKAGHTTALIDLDPQASAVKWSHRREGDSPVVISAHSTLLNQVLETAEERGVSLCILDTSPHSESATLDAAKVADLAVIPSRPSIFDLEAVGDTIQIAKISRRCRSGLSSMASNRRGVLFSKPKRHSKFMMFRVHPARLGIVWLSRIRSSMV